ncbi:hypothetical protein FOMPIDRAFT_1022649 [Fomitopsis schrenkii]|uniref:Uncharacterized protein n=1 Tax=Fomitopsis schrenkii TaxID=2126942 RepID=S8EEU4_FOMSC|nr:hypothetical protein FOMPIDRAFT_1022649 [Fomitopsis schrenkii]
MALSPSDKDAASTQRPIESRRRAAGSSRGAPLGPRKAPEKPTRNRTIDTSSLSTSSTVRSASNANRSQALDSLDLHAQTRSSPAVAGPSKVHSTSQPVVSPLSNTFDMSFPTTGHGGSAGSLSLLSSKSHSHVAGMTLPARLGPGRNAHQFRKVSGTSTDGNLSDAGAHLDFKRLMSKPAVHTTSSSSAISLPSDSELSTSSRHFAQATALSFGLHPSQQDPLALKPPSRGSAAGAPSREPVQPTSQTASPCQPASSPQEKEPPKKPNVLRRRPSTTDAQNLTTRPVPSRRRMHSIDGLKTLITQDGVVQAGSTRKTAPASTAALTPAGQVALAYIQQEQRRSELEQLSGWNDRPTSISGGKEGHEVPRGVSLEIAEEEETTGPYYTVFGSGLSHVPANSPFVGELGTTTYVAGGGEPFKKTSKRTLPRKMSGSFKRVAEMVKGDREHLGRSLDETWRSYDVKPPRSPKPPCSADDQGSSHSPSRSNRTARNSSHSPRSMQDKEWPRGREKPGDDCPPRAGPSRLGYNKGMQSEREDEGVAGGKWWKLVKRISTGGLRDKYRERSRTSTPPPVPPLPLETPKSTETRTTFDTRGSPVKEMMADDHMSAKSSPLLRRSSGSGARPSTGSSQKAPLRHTVASRSSTGSKQPATPSVPRPSTTTRSSSPISSEPASSGFFPKSRSPRSSASSYGDEIPPVPTSHSAIVGHRIMSPNELGRLDTSSLSQKAPTKRKPVRTASEPTAELKPYTTSSADEKPHSLRPPPRRPGTHPRDACSQERSASPTLPSFSTEDCVNNFSPTALSPSTAPLSEFGSAPPRPKRSSRRMPASIEVPSFSAVVASGPHSARAPPTPRTPRPSVKTALDRFAPGRESTSTVNASSTAKASTPSLSSSPVSSSTSPSSVSSQRSPPVFRELESPRHAWTEQEKQDKWEALLERSARAGGTLHIGDTGLLSDNIRLSKFEL